MGCLLIELLWYSSFQATMLVFSHSVLCVTNSRLGQMAEVTEVSSPSVVHRSGTQSVHAPCCNFGNGNSLVIYELSTFVLSLV